jgi:hypothetical protein
METIMHRTYLLILALVWAGTATAQEVSLGSYLASMDRTAVTFSGRIKYDSSDDDFTLYDESQNFFHVAIDAGRDARERIETLCNNTSFMVSYDDLCTIAGSGTIEIRGSRIFISIEQVNQLSE